MGAVGVRFSQGFIEFGAHQHGEKVAQKAGSEMGTGIIL